MSSVWQTNLLTMKSKDKMIKVDLRIENAKRIGKLNITHNKSKEPIYHVWRSMLSRCYYKKDKYYISYGARGITVCDVWHTFEGFYKDMGNRPKGMTLDRIDNNKGYYKENCKWSTLTEQANNRRSNRVITYKNKTLTLIQWSKEMGISYDVLKKRISYKNWNIDKILTMPVRIYGK